MGQEKEQITFYPNPAHDFLFADVMQTENALLKLKMIDVSGRIWKEMQFETEKGANHLEVDIHDLLPGIYSIQIIQNDQVKKVIRMTKN